MTLSSRLLARYFRLPPAETKELAVDRDLRVPMPDGVDLLADRWRPSGAEGDEAPTLLLRTPYGRRTVTSTLGRLFAERGYQVVTVSCRGTFGSQGEWNPFFNERADGLAVLDWLGAQPWFRPPVALIGPSYVGLTQWAVAGATPDWVVAVTPDVTSSWFRQLFYPGNSFTLSTSVAWIDSLAHQELKGRAFAMSLLTGARRRRRAFATLPLCEADVAVSGGQMPYWRDWLEHAEPGDPWWDPVDFGRHLEHLPPASMVAGWYDIFLLEQLRDFVNLRRAGRDVRITIGPWTHSAPGGAKAMLHDNLDWAGVHLKGRRSARSTPVRVLVMGADTWVDLPDWPPSPAVATRFHLQAGGRLGTEAPGPSAPDRFRYDPADPTPSIGGATLDSHRAGRQPQKGREERSDVLCYTTDVLADDLTVIGDLTAELHVRSSIEHTDFFVRLCDVDGSGKSVNISDGILRIDPRRPPVLDPDGPVALTIPMFPTACTFRRGHRIRLQVSSGAHPLYARNPGSGEPLGKATTLVAAEQQVFHDPDHMSSITLPVMPEPVRAERRRR